MMNGGGYRRAPTHTGVTCQHHRTVDLRLHTANIRKDLADQGFRVTVQRL